MLYNLHGHFIYCVLLELNSVGYLYLYCITQTVCDILCNIMNDQTGFIDPEKKWTAAVLVTFSEVFYTSSLTETHKLV